MGSISDEIILDHIVEDKDESTTSTSENVGEASLEEGFTTLLLEDLSNAIHGTVVKLIFSSLTSGHHESSSNGIKWVGDDTSNVGDDLGVDELLDEEGLLVVGEEDLFTSIESTEVGGSVSDDTNDGDTETSVETLDTVLLEVLDEAVNETGEFSILSGTNISGESGSSEVEWVDDGEGSGTCSTTRGHVTNEEHTWLGLWIIWAEDLLVEVFAGEVKSLSWEVTNNVGEVTSPEGTGSLLSDDSLEAVTNSVVSLISWDVLVSILDLEEELDSLNWGDESLRDGSGNTGNHEVLKETCLLLLWHCIIYLLCNKIMIKRKRCSV